MDVGELLSYQVWRSRRAGGTVLSPRQESQDQSSFISLSPISSLGLGPLISLVNQVPFSNFSWVLSINYDPQVPDLFLTSSGPLLTQPWDLTPFHFSEGPRLSSQPFPFNSLFSSHWVEDRGGRALSCIWVSASLLIGSVALGQVLLSSWSLNFCMYKTETVIATY